MEDKIFSKCNICDNNKNCICQYCRGLLYYCGKAHKYCFLNSDKCDTNEVCRFFNDKKFTLSNKVVYKQKSLF